MLYKSTKVLADVCCALLICLTLFTENAKAQPNCLDMVLENVITCNNSEPKTKVIEDKMFGNGCNITIYYTERKCIVADPNCPGGTREAIAIIIQGMNIPFDTLYGSPCYFLQSFLNPPAFPDNFAPSIDRFRHFFGTAIESLSDEVFKEYYLDNQTPSFHCDGIYPYCQNPDPESCPPMQISVTMPKCQNICVKLNEQEGIIEYTFVSDCITSETACCVWKNYYCACVDGQGDLKQVRVTREGSPTTYPYDPEQGCGHGIPLESCPNFTPMPTDAFWPCYEHCP